MTLRTKLRSLRERLRLGPKGWRWLLVVWILGFSCTVGVLVQQNRELALSNRRLAIESKRLALENQRRTDDIQQSRKASCRQTYEGIRDVFKPFFPPPPRTRQQQADLDKFNRTVERLKARCVKQTTAGVDTGGTP